MNNSIAKNVSEHVILTKLDQTSISENSRFFVFVLTTLGGTTVTMFPMAVLSSIFAFNLTMWTILSIMSVPILSAFFLRPKKVFSPSCDFKSREHEVTKRQLKKFPDGRQKLSTVNVEKDLTTMAKPINSMRTSDHWHYHKQPTMKIEESFVLIDNKVFLEQKVTPLPLALWDNTFDNIMELEESTAELTETEKCNG